MGHLYANLTRPRQTALASSVPNKRPLYAPASIARSRFHCMLILSVPHISFTLTLLFANASSFPPAPSPIFLHCSHQCRGRFGARPSCRLLRPVVPSVAVSPHLPSIVVNLAPTALLQVGQLILNGIFDCTSILTISPLPDPRGAGPESVGGSSIARVSAFVSACQLRLRCVVVVVNCTGP
ncbi:hypothetical protein FA95DRAFT_511263 [Auriscalpium vulgare]|uniref:Uncharacterized protein n=1 Tax=Auriscalpium vulgare TaxID=40419 RepID=A0ACB8RGR6_9AGAM|nr:hypothetical protein FA95DRAFT_511263 [Auriscalpium vulgare]